MSDGADEGLVTKGLGGALYALASGLIGWATSGFLHTALGYLLAIAGAVLGLWFSLLHRRYAGVLAASALPADNDEREGYLALRRSLAEGGAVARLYAARLNRFLAGVERFFGDEGMAGRSLFPHAFGLRTAAPLWTAPAFDRCLLLALIYPVVTIFLIWVVSGHVGPAEASLGLPPGLAMWQRSAPLGSAGFMTIAMGHLLQAEGWKAIAWPFISAVAVAIAFPGVVAFFVTVTDGFAGGLVLGSVLVLVLAGTLGFTLSGAVAFTGTVAFCFSVAFVRAFGFTGAFVRAFAIAGAFAVIVASAFVYKKSIQGRWQGMVLVLSTCFLVIAFFIFAYQFSYLKGWKVLGPMALFLGLLTVINAPFDWASLGLTRALLRRGLELGGWWPMILALVDAAAAALIVAMLAIAMALGVQAFDSLAVLGEGTVVLPLDRLLTGIGNRETALEPEFWWVYALLLSTLLPSLINLGIGGASLMRGLPLVPSLLLQHLPADKPVRSYERTWISLVLAMQTVGGVILGVVVQGLLFWAMIAYVMPWLGLNLLNMIRDILALNLPERAWRLIGLVP